MTEIMLPPKNAAWQGYTALERLGPDVDWAPLDGGVYVGEEISYIASLYESGDQEPALVTKTEVFGTAYNLRSSGFTAFPPSWDDETHASSQLFVGKEVLDAPNQGDRVSALRTVKVSFSIPDYITNITGVKLRVSTTKTGGWENSTTAASIYSNETWPSSFTCDAQNWTENWDEPSYSGNAEPWAVTNWSGKWDTDHFTYDAGDHQFPMSGDAFSGAPVEPADLLSEYESDAFGAYIPLADWGSHVSPGGSASLNLGIDDEPGIINFGNWAGGVSPTLATHMEACFGTAPEPEAQDFYSPFHGGITLGIMALIIEHDPIPIKETWQTEYDWRGIVYFDLTELPEGDPVSVDLLFWAVYAWSSEEGSTVYTVPIDPTNPSQEGPMPIEIERHHPVGLEDKSSRAVWSSGINALEISEPELIEVPLSPTIFSGLEQIGFQFAIKPETSDPFTFHYFDVFTEIGSGSPHSPYTGPRLRIVYEGGFVIEIQAAIRVNRALAGDAAFSIAVSGDPQIEPDRRILNHQARKQRGY